MTMLSNETFPHRSDRQKGTVLLRANKRAAMELASCRQIVICSPGRRRKRRDRGVGRHPPEVKIAEHVAIVNAARRTGPPTRRSRDRRLHAKGARETSPAYPFAPATRPAQA